MPVNTPTSFETECGGRGTVGIIWSCLSTWFVCLWVIFHINIPAPSDSEITRTVRKVGFMLFGSLAPEFIASVAYTQRRNAQILFLEYQALWRASNFPMPCLDFPDSSRNYGRVAAEGLRKVPVDDWTLKHSFYCLMGGFVISPPGSKKSFPVNGDQLLWLLKSGYIEWPVISLEEIQDKSKSDTLLKSIAILQTVWFLVQCVARGAQGLAVTTLEITTVAYIACMIPCQLLWWSKPYNVSVGTSLKIIDWPSGTCEKLEELSFKEGISFFRKRNLLEFPRMINNIVIEEDCFVDWRAGWWNQPSWITTVSTGIIFGGVHCIAWNFQFPTSAEAWLWRASSPLIIFLGILGVFSYWVRSRDYIRLKQHHQVLQFIQWAYLITRIILMVEIFIAFRSMAKDAYLTVNWVSWA